MFSTRRRRKGGEGLGRASKLHPRLEGQALGKGIRAAANGMQVAPAPVLSRNEHVIVHCAAQSHLPQALSHLGRVLSQPPRLAVSPVRPRNGRFPTCFFLWYNQQANHQIQAKYERLVDAHKRLQRNNICLEEKLLKVNN